MQSKFEVAASSTLSSETVLLARVNMYTINTKIDANVA